VDERSQLHPLLRSRFSPLEFDKTYELAAADLATILEAARWAPSAGNSQPWAFLACLRGTPEHARLVDHLAPSSRRWAPSAGALVVTLVHRRVTGTTWEYSEFADYDLGQAVAHLTFQAQSLGLACRQFRAFDLEALADSIAIEDGWDVMTMIALGRSAQTTPPDRERLPVRTVSLAPRSR
jgi:nitroreductase